MIRLTLTALLLLLPAQALAWNGMGYTRDDQTLPWSLNSSGSNSMSFGAAEQILTDAYDEWQSPGCTDDYNGTTSRSSTSNNDGYTSHGFLQSWPGSYGSPWGVIGTTVSSFWGGSFYEADVSFNEEVYTFLDGAPSGWGYEADLNSIAVHEFGHSLGLDHSNASGSSMLPSYSGGDMEADLSSDDTDAVCTLYPGCGPAPGDDDDDDDDVPSGDDAFEPNDEEGSATSVSCGTSIDGVAADQDWFVVDTPATGAIDATLTWSNSADLDLYLLSASDTLDSSEEWEGTLEEVSASSVPAGTYWIVVNPYEGSGAYELEIDCAGAPPGDDDDDQPGDDDDDSQPEGDDSHRSAGCTCDSGAPASALAVGAALRRRTYRA